MNKLSNYIAKSDEPKPPQRSTIECMADGCPLPGSYRITNKTSVCAVHDAAPANRWPAITERIRPREKAFLAARELLNATPQTDPPVRIEIAFERLLGDIGKRTQKIYGFANQTPPARGAQIETARDYGSRMLRILTAQALGDANEIPSEARELFDNLRTTVRIPEGDNNANAAD